MGGVEGDDMDKDTEEFSDDEDSYDQLDWEEEEDR